MLHLKGGGFSPATPWLVLSQTDSLVGTDVKWSSQISTSVFGDAPFYGLNENGIWDTGRHGFVGLNLFAGSMSFTFANPVRSVGALVNYVPFGYGDAFISIYDSQNNLIETLNISVSTPISTLGNTNAGAFRGFTVESPIISRFELSGAYIVADDLQFISTIVPEPSTHRIVALLLGPLMFRAVRKMGASTTS